MYWQRIVRGSHVLIDVWILDLVLCVTVTTRPVLQVSDYSLLVVCTIISLSCEEHLHAYFFIENFIKGFLFYSFLVLLLKATPVSLLKMLKFDYMGIWRPLSISCVTHATCISVITSKILFVNSVYFSVEQRIYFFWPMFSYFYASCRCVCYIQTMFRHVY